MKQDMRKALPFLVGPDWYGDAMWRMFEFEQAQHARDSRESVEEAVEYSSDARVIRDRHAYSDEPD